jgi:dTDP-4-amino-4,6-dideoxygalactose transaminase
MSVPFVDLKRQYSPVMDRILEKTADIISSCRFIGGEEHDLFLSELAHWWGMPGAVGVSSATLGLYGALKSLGTGPGHEVITTVHTAIPTSEAITMTGARVVFCDINPGTYALDADKARDLITDRTRAIIPVHLYGQCADMDKIMDLADKHDLLVVEDCAQAQGAMFRGKMAGTMGHAAVLSFFPSKNHGGIGDGGAVSARDQQALEYIRMFCNHGRKKKYMHEFEGTNARLDNIKAAMLRITLPLLDQWNSRRREAAGWYQEGLSGIEEITLPLVDERCEHVYHLYVILVDDREGPAGYLRERGIKTGLHYPCSLNLLPAYKHLNQGPGSFPVAEDVCSRVLSLPMFPGITRDEVQEVCQTLKSYYAAKK